jgi:glycosyltransferase involved in cell wall biosynthesis
MKYTSKITSLFASEILDSRGNPTVEVVIELDGWSAPRAQETYTLIRTDSSNSKTSFNVGTQLFWRDTSAYLRYRSLFKKESFDLVWVHNTVGFGMVILLALKKVRVIETYHDIQFLHPSGLMLFGKEQMLSSVFARIYRVLLRIYAPRQLVQIFPSNWLEKIYARFNMTGQKVLVLRNQSPELEPQALMGDGPDFLFVGQLEPHKGVQLLLESFIRLSDRKLSLWIIGDGSLGPALKEKYSQKNIRFLGRLDNPLPYIASSRCLVVPSLCYENLPTVILEAALFKTLAIGSRLGGIVEALGDERLSFLPKVENLEKKLQDVLDHRNDLTNHFLEAQKKYPPLSVDEYLDVLSVKSGISL